MTLGELSPIKWREEWLNMWAEVVRLAIFYGEFDSKNAAQSECARLGHRETEDGCTRCGLRVVTMTRKNRRLSR